MSDDLTYVPENLPQSEGGADYVEGEGLWTGGEAVRAAILGRRRYRSGSLKKLRREHETSLRAAADAETERVRRWREEGAPAARYG